MERLQPAGGWLVGSDPVAAGIVVVVLIFPDLLVEESLREPVHSPRRRSDVPRDHVGPQRCRAKGSRATCHVRSASTFGFRPGHLGGTSLHRFCRKQPFGSQRLRPWLRFRAVMSALLRAPPVFVAMLLALAATDGWTLMSLTGIVFLTVDLITSHVIEPRVYGQATGLSPLSIVLATLFWGWLWGPVGVIIATPLTLCLAVARGATPNHSGSSTSFSVTARR
jgi:hypothetical protein